MTMATEPQDEQGAEHLDMRTPPEEKADGVQKEKKSLIQDPPKKKQPATPADGKHPPGNYMRTTPHYVRRTRDLDGPRLETQKRAAYRGRYPGEDVATERSSSNEDDGIPALSSDTDHFPRRRSPRTVTHRARRRASSRSRSRPSHGRRNSNKDRSSRHKHKSQETSESRSASSDASPDPKEYRKMRRRLQQLEEELARSKKRASSPLSANVPTVPQTFQVLHYIGKTAYLDQPRWELADSGPVLLANRRVRNEGHYLDQHPELAFVFYRYYSDSGWRRDQKIMSSDGVLQEAQSERESLRMVSYLMIDAVAEFTRRVPNFYDMFPGFRPEKDIPAPFLFMYYSLEHAEAICEELTPPHKQLVELLVHSIRERYGTEYAEASRRAEKGLMTKTSLPYLIKPGDLLIQPNGRDTRAYRALTWPTYLRTEPMVRSAEEDEKCDTESKRELDNNAGVAKREAAHPEHVFGFEAWTFDFDGVFQMTKHLLEIRIPLYHEDDEVDMTSLNIFPLQFATQEWKSTLRLRGEIFWKCRVQRFIAYQPIGNAALTNTSERYMIDVPTWKIFAKSVQGKPTLPDLRDDLGSAIQVDVPPEDYISLFPPSVPGYNLSTKIWEKLFVDQIQDVKWNKSAFEHLVIDEDTKELVQALVTNKLAEDQQTDLISGKGGGLILLLHGGPGTGKTFTAEGVAEFAERPLLRVTGGDIGINAREVENYLGNIFHLGKIWDCVVLLDEADVFLEERNIDDLNRNALVSVFLRVLEYYQGILILTSNRVGTFDEAFKSRIQLAIHYESLTVPQRRKIWRNFITRVKNIGGDNIDFDDIADHIDELGQEEMNGREIRNAITTARQLAKYQRKKFQYSHLRQAITVGGRFAKYLRTLYEVTDDERMRGNAIR